MLQYLYTATVYRAYNVPVGPYQCYSTYNTIAYKAMLEVKDDCISVLSLASASFDLPHCKFQTILLFKFLRIGWVVKASQALATASTLIQ